LGFFIKKGGGGEAGGRPGAGTSAGGLQLRLSRFWGAHF